MEPVEGFTPEDHGAPWRSPEFSMALHALRGDSLFSMSSRASNVSAGPTLAPSRAMTNYEPDPVAGQIIGAAIEVHRLLGPGLLESTYQVCLAWELLRQGLRIERQVALPVLYKGERLECGYRIDLLVDGDFIVEVKSVERLLPIFDAQVLTYLRLSRARRALLLNFNARTLRDGLRSYVRGRPVPEHVSDIPDRSPQA
jgi:GxxExxY protein